MPQAPAQSKDSTLKNTAKDVSIIALAAVVVVVIVVIAGTMLFIRALNRVLYNDNKIAPTFECAAWLTQRQQGYLSGSPLSLNPATNSPYTIREATKQAVNDSQLPGNATACPVKKTPPDVDQQPPYLFYMAAQNCSNA